MANLVDERKRIAISALATKKADNTDYNQLSLKIANLLKEIKERLHKDYDNLLVLDNYISGTDGFSSLQLLTLFNYLQLESCIAYLNKCKFWQTQPCEAWTCDSCADYCEDCTDCDCDCGDCDSCDSCDCDGCEGDCGDCDCDEGPCVDCADEADCDCICSDDCPSDS